VSALAIEGLRKSFGEAPVLDGLSLEVAAGSLTAVLGPSGCGKTTLLRVIAGFEAADAGAVRLGGTVLCDEAVSLPPERRGVGFVAQEGALFPHLDVAANIGFGLPRAGRRGTRVAELLSLVGLEGMERRYPHQLSGGQQQRVALARALAPGPGLVLLDEPFDALDAGLRAQVRGEVREVLRRAGATALLVTHDQEEALSLADRVAVMRDGLIAQVGDPRTIYFEPADLELALFLGEGVVLEATLNGEVAETALGGLKLRRAAAAGRGPATVLLRPEQICCVAGGRDGLPRGTVVETDFFGHDGVARVRVAGAAGLELAARTAGHRLAMVGEEVSLAVEGEAWPIARRGLASHPGHLRPAPAVGDSS
jgi:iron(III) transport system ATP-binding protein